MFHISVHPFGCIIAEPCLYRFSMGSTENPILWCFVHSYFLFETQYYLSGEFSNQNSGPDSSPLPKVKLVKTGSDHQLPLSTWFGLTIFCFTQSIPLSKGLTIFLTRRYHCLIRKLVNLFILIGIVEKSFEIMSSGSFIWKTDDASINFKVKKQMTSWFWNSDQKRFSWFPLKWILFELSHC